MRRALVGLLLAGCFLSGCYLNHGTEVVPAPRPEPQPEPPPIPGPIPFPPVEGDWFVYRTEPEGGPARRWSPRQTWLMDLQSGQRRLVHEAPDDVSVFRVTGAGRLVGVEMTTGRAGEGETVLMNVDGESRTLPAGRVRVSADGSTALVVTASQALTFDSSIAPRRGMDRFGVGGFAASPSLGWMLEPMGGGGTYAVTNLRTGSQQITELNGELIGDTFFDATDTFAYVATAPVPEIWSVPSYSLRRVTLESGRASPAALPVEETPLGFRPCDDSLVTVTPEGAVREHFADDLATRELGPALPYRGVTLGFAVDARMSPDGRHLLWLGESDGEHVLQLTELESGLTRTVDIGPMPPSSSCCGEVFRELVFGNFRGGRVAVGVTVHLAVPICDCAPVDLGIETAAFRVDLATGEAQRAEHCGLTVPWLTADGGLLVCERDDADDVRLVNDHLDGRVETVSEGPFDVGVFPLERDSAPRCGP